MLALCFSQGSDGVITWGYLKSSDSPLACCYKLLLLGTLHINKFSYLVSEMGLYSWDNVFMI